MAYGPSSRLRRWWMTCALLIGTTHTGGCMLLLDKATACDADESRAVREYVQASGTVPESAVATGHPTGSRRFVKIVGVEDRAIQDKIVAAAAEARRLHSTKPVVVTFHAGPIVKRADGGATFARDTWSHELRRETIP